jgi:hypothetical protein
MILTESVQGVRSGGVKNRRRILKRSVKEVWITATAEDLGGEAEVEDGAVEVAVGILPVVGEEITAADATARPSRTGLLAQARRGNDITGRLAVIMACRIRLFDERFLQLY